MRKLFLCTLFILLYLSGSSQSDMLSDWGVNIKRANIYLPVLKVVYKDFKSTMLEGTWTGNIKYNSRNQSVAHGYGEWQFVHKGRLLWSITGSANYGEFSGYIVFYTYSDVGIDIFEGYVSNGIPHGKFIFKDNKKRIFSANYSYGIINGKLIADLPNKEPFSVNCGEITFEDLMTNESVILEKCRIDYEVDDLLFSFATIISVIATITDEHITIDDFFNCFAQNAVGQMIEDPWSDPLLIGQNYKKIKKK